jgi:MFS family permease
VRRFAVDLAPLRTSRDFRLLWFGEVVSQTGTQITLVALFVQVYDLTGSSAAVGAVGLVQLVPMVVVSLLMGPVIDRVDRRRVLVWAQAGQALASSLLLLGALLGDPPLALVFGAAALNAAFVSVALPARSAATPGLVPPELLPSATALNQVMWNGAAVVGPAVGGLLVDRVGVAWAYGLDVLTYVVAFGCALALRPLLPKRDEGAAEERGVEAIRAGLRYLRGRRVLQSTFTLDIVAMVFAMPRALFPQLAEEQFHGGDEIVGLLLSAMAAGALVAALTSGWVGRVQYPGRAVFVSVVLWGTAVTLFGFVGDRLALALVLLALAGAADVVSAVFRSTIQQLSVPDALRGRLASFNILVVTGGPRLGDARAGALAAAASPRFSLVSGGACCVVGAVLIVLAVPRFLRWRIGDPA